MRDGTGASPLNVLPVRKYAARRRMVLNFSALIANTSVSVIGSITFFALAARRLGPDGFTDLLVISSITGLVFGSVTGAVTFHVIRHDSRLEEHGGVAVWHTAGVYAALLTPVAVGCAALCMAIRGPSALPG